MGKGKGIPLYDHGDNERMPKSIVGLTQNIYFQQSHVQNGTNDYFGYVAYQIQDGYHGESYMSVLQWLIQDIFEDIKVENVKSVSFLSFDEISEEDDGKDEMRDFKLADSVTLYPL